MRMAKARAQGGARVIRESATGKRRRLSREEKLVKMSQGGRNKNPQTGGTLLQVAEKWGGGPLNRDFRGTATKKKPAGQHVQILLGQEKDSLLMSRRRHST